MRMNRIISLGTALKLYDECLVHHCGDHQFSVYHQGLELSTEVLAPSQGQQLIKSRELFHVPAQNTCDLVMAKWPYSIPKKISVV